MNPYKTSELESMQLLITQFRSRLVANLHLEWLSYIFLDLRQRSKHIKQTYAYHRRHTQGSEGCGEGGFVGREPPQTLGGGGA